MSPPTQVCERFYEGGEEIVEIPLLTVTVEVNGIAVVMVWELEMKIIA